MEDAELLLFLMVAQTKDQRHVLRRSGSSEGVLPATLSELSSDDRWIGR